MSTASNEAPAGRPYGIALVTGAVLAVALVTHHPTHHGQWLVNALVHGGIIAVLGVFAYGFAGLTGRLGEHSVFGRLGFIAFVFGAAGMIAAALVSGFIVEELIKGYVHSAGDERDVDMILRPAIGLCRAINQVCAKLGVLATAAALALWSLHLLHVQGSRAIGAVGVVAGVGLAAAMPLGYLRMNVHGMIAFGLVLAGWSVAVGVQLIRGKI